MNKPIMQRLLYWLSGYLKVRPIPPKGEVYMERYFLFQLEFFGITAYLHRFLLSDPGRDLHNHPWDWAISILLSSWYEEERVDWEGFCVRRKIICAPAVNVIGDMTVHRVNMGPGIETWSLFIHGPWTKVWGFAKFKHMSGPHGVEWHDGLLGSLKDGPQMFDSMGIEPYPPSVKNHVRYGRLGDRWWVKAPRGRDIRLPS